MDPSILLAVAEVIRLLINGAQSIGQAAGMSEAEINKLLKLELEKLELNDPNELKIPGEENA